MLMRSWNLALLLVTVASTLSAAPRYYRSSVEMAFSYLGESPTAGPDDKIKRQKTFHLTNESHHNVTLKKVCRGSVPGSG